MSKRLSVIVLITWMILAIPNCCKLTASNSKLKISVILMFVVSFLAFAVFESEARPKYMKRYNADKKSKAEYRNKCTICHIGRGGGENTSFGESFAD